MPVKGLKRIQQNASRRFMHISGSVSEKIMHEVLITGAVHAAAITPRDTSTLVNSQFRIVRKLPTGIIGKMGYTANYAAYVAAASGKLKGKPRSSVKSFSTKSGKTAFESNQGRFWDPSGEPDFLNKGFERDGLDEIKSIIVRGYKI